MEVVNQARGERATSHQNMPRIKRLGALAQDFAVATENNKTLFSVTGRSYLCLLICVGI